jgi:hypothetical protein
MNDASNPQNAYPAFWAPFEIVAEGAAQKFLAVEQPADDRNWHKSEVGRCPH